MPKLSNFKALLFDVDNTLTNSQRLISNETQHALKKLVDNGYLIGLCTGRPYVTLQKTVLPYFPGQGLDITNGGGQLSYRNGSVVWQKTIPEVTAAALGKTLLSNHVDFFLAKADCLYVTPRKEDYFKSHPFGTPYKLTTELNTWETTTIGVYDFYDEVKELVSPYLEELTIKEQRGHASGGTFADITAVGVNKALGLAKWCELQNINQSQVIGFGDGENDLEFLTQVGYAVAMGNSQPEVKELADRIIGRHDEEGLASYLNTILEGTLL